MGFFQKTAQLRTHPKDQGPEDADPRLDFQGRQPYLRRQNQHRISRIIQEAYRIGQNQIGLDGIITEFSDTFSGISHFLAEEKKRETRK